MALSVSRLARLVRYSPGLASGLRGVAGLVLTRRCDMACAYCSIRRPGKEEYKGKEISVEGWKSAVDALRKLKVNMVVLTGGEPTLHGGIIEIAGHARKDMLVSLVSNGRFLLRNKEFARRLLGYIDLISVSADAFMDSGGGFKAGELDGAASLIDEMGLNREMIFTITKNNIGELPEAASFTGKRGWGVRFSLVHAGNPQHPFRGTGTALAPGKEHADALGKMVSSIENLRSGGLPIIDNRLFLRGIPEFVRGEKTLSCPAGIKTMEIDEDGTVQACQDSPSTGFRAADLLTMKDPDEFLRNSRLPSCRCHYSHYHRIFSRGKAGHALSRFISMFPRPFVGWNKKQ
ncbi:MAG: radical SAM protein [Deltaproteobacteria bacterium]|nr:radical SAM protein [Deltaproteobacteria bacterium]